MIGSANICDYYTLLIFVCQEGFSFFSTTTEFPIAQKKEPSLTPFFILLFCFCRNGHIKMIRVPVFSFCYIDYMVAQLIQLLLIG